MSFQATVYGKYFLLDRIAIGGSSQGGVYEVVRGTEQAPDGRPREFWGRDQWQVVAQVIHERNPRTIAVNVSNTHNFADGMTLGEWEQFNEALGPAYTGRIRRAETLALDYLAIRVPEMNATYRRMQELVHQTIATAFSSEVITPGNAPLIKRMASMVSLAELANSASPVARVNTSVSKTSDSG